MDVPSLFLLLAGLIVLVLLGAGAMTLLGRTREASSRLDRLLAQTAASRDATESVSRRFEEMRRSVDARVQGVEARLAEGQKSLADQLGSSGAVLRTVGERLGQISEASRKIEQLAGNVTRLEELLKPPKIRGTLGEAFLEEALRQALPPGSWKLQHRFSTGETVDALVRMGDVEVPIDSKFPLENWRRAHEAAEEVERRRARREFAADVRRHAESIRRKYVRPEEGTTDFAFMYVPAEAVYAEVALDAEGGALADECVAARVFPVSPRLLYAFLSTVALSLRSQEMQKRAQEILERLSQLERLWGEVEEPFDKLGRHLGNTEKQFEEASRALDRFGARLSGIAQAGLEEAESAENVEPFPLLRTPS
ncbi:MAG TPA: DNA recombination protein RmuC [Thermoanaerobaculia bacterium]